MSTVVLSAAKAASAAGAYTTAREILADAAIVDRCPRCIELYADKPKFSIVVNGVSMLLCYVCGYNLDVIICESEVVCDSHYSGQSP